MSTAVLDDLDVNVFAGMAGKSWKNRYRGRLRFRDRCLGGTPSDEKVAKGWLAAKLQTQDEALMTRVKEVMMERAVNVEEAMKIVGDLKLLKGFRGDADGLYLESRILKANLREGCAVAQAAGLVSNKREFGVTKSGVRSFFAEHVMIVQNRLHLRGNDGAVLTKPDGIQQRFVHVFNGSSITYEEYVDNAHVEFDLITDWDWPEDFWPHVWNKAAELGLGATRSQGFGRYIVNRWEQIA